MYLVLLLAAGAILGGVVVVAMGRGGEMAVFSRDLPVAFVPIRTPSDVATLRLPIAPFGYQVQATADALTSIANLLAERDYEIAALRGQIWRLETGTGASGADDDRAAERDPHGSGGRSGGDPGDPGDPGDLGALGALGALGSPGALSDSGETSESDRALNSRGGNE